LAGLQTDILIFALLILCIILFGIILPGALLDFGSAIHGRPDYGAVFCMFLVSGVPLKLEKIFYWFLFFRRLVPA
jgi:hypothetical protein